MQASADAIGLFVSQYEALEDRLRAPQSAARQADDAAKKSSALENWTPVILYERTMANLTAIAAVEGAETPPNAPAPADAARQVGVFGADLFDVWRGRHADLTDKTAHETFGRVFLAALDRSALETCRIVEDQAAFGRDLALISDFFRSIPETFPKETHA